MAAMDLPPLGSESDDEFAEEADEEEFSSAPRCAFQAIMN